jgi:hypothetical protein
MPEDIGENHATEIAKGELNNSIQDHRRVHKLRSL